MKRLATALAAAVVVLAVLLLATFAIPVRVWRTGERPAPPLPVIAGGPPVAMPKRVWIDTDAACGESPTTDPDDCFALLMLAGAPEIEIAGISVVHGNAGPEVTERTTRALVAVLEPEDGPLEVHRGAAALRTALGAGPLTIVALGPLTNIAAALQGRPDLRKNVGRLVAVMGRRPGHLFHPSEGAGGGMLFGHGPVFRDFNFEKDREAAAKVLAMRLPLTLIPYEAARQISVTARDLERLEAAGAPARWVASRAGGWLAFWQEEVGKSGFYPFDLVAAAYVLRHEGFGCAATEASVAEDERLWGWVYGPEALLVGTDAHHVSEARASGAVLYCPEVDERVHAWLMERLSRP